MTPESTRPLSDRERLLLTHILHELDGISGVDELIGQLSTVRVRGGTAMFLDLDISSTAPRSSRADGVLPARSFVADDDGTPTGEIVIWVTQGYLSGLEYAWVTDELPTEWPTLTHVSVTAVDQ